jgi:TRAP-type mannitol/chloroaromatic compound transport system permease small subunit
MLRLENFVKNINAISAWTGEIAQYLLLPITLLVFMEVFLRYIFNAPTIWGYEMTEYLFGILSMIGGAYCMRFNVHVNMSLIHDHLSATKKALIDIFTSFFVFFFCGVLMWKGWTFAWAAVLNLERSGTVWDPPYWPYLFFLPVSAALMILQGLGKLMTDVAMIIKGRESI